MTFISNTGASFLGNRGLADGGLGNSISMDGTGRVTSLLSNNDVWTWASIGDFISDTDVSYLGTRSTSGYQTSIAQDNDGAFYAMFDKGDVWTWASADEFATDTDASFISNRPGAASDFAIFSSISIPEASSFLVWSLMTLGLGFIRYGRIRRQQ